MLTKIKSLNVIGIFLVSLLLFTVGLSSQEIIGFDARFYLFALEMWRHGPSWFPTTYHQPYPDYPGTATYLIYLASCLFGSLNKLTAVFPSAVAAAVTVSVTYLIGALHQRKWGWYAVCFLFFTLTFITDARSISLDQYIAAITAICFYLVERSYFQKRALSLMIIAALLIFAFAIRGPIGIVIPTAVICVCHLLEKNGKQFFIQCLLSGFLLCLCMATLLFLAHHVGGDAFLKDVLNMQIGSRIADPHRPPLFYYFKDSVGGYAVTYPLAVLIFLSSLSVLFKKDASVEIKFLRKCFAWALVIMVGMTIPADKKMRYILSVAPAFALICAYVFLYPRQNRFSSLIYYFFKTIFFILPLIALVLMYFISKQHVDVKLNYVFLGLSFLVLQLLIIYFRKNSLIVVGVTAFTFFITNVLIVEKIKLETNKTREFVLSVEAMRTNQHVALVFYQEGRDGLPVKYIVNMPGEDYPQYLSRPEELSKLKEHTFVIMSEEKYGLLDELMKKKLRLVMRGEIGHERMFVLTRLSS